MGVSWKRRYVQLGQMQRSLRMLHGEIRYTGAELPEALDQIALRQEKQKLSVALGLLSGFFIIILLI